MNKFLVLAGLVSALALPAVAQQNWRQYDRNNDGKITFGELRDSGINVNQQIRALDRNNDRVLSGRELRNVQFSQGNNQNPYTTYQQPYNANVPTNGYHWSVLDTNRNGRLEQQELQAAGYQGGNANFNMYAVDLNRDGYIDQYEAQRAGYNGNNGNNTNNGSTILNLLQVLPSLLNR